MTTSSDSSIYNSAACLAIARINAIHVSFWCTHTHTDSRPFHTLMHKLRSYLVGELSSVKNLLHAQDEFYTWQTMLTEQENLAYRIAELTCTSLYTSVNCLFDEGTDDLNLIIGSINQIYDEMDDLCTDTRSQRRYWQDIQNEMKDIVTLSAQRPLPKRYFTWLDSFDTSLFGAS